MGKVRTKYRKNINKPVIHVKENPFNLRINRQKSLVLGRTNVNIIKGQIGNPGKSHTKAYNERCKVYRVEKHSRRKNFLKDHRLQSKLSGEEMSLQRLALQRQLEIDQQKGGEEQTLTHCGHAISTLPKFDGPLDSDSDGDCGILGGNVVNANFGGLTHKETQHTAYKDRVAQLILDSKERKYDRQSEKEKSKDQMDILNSQLKQKWDVLRFKAASDREKKQDMILPLQENPLSFEETSKMLQMERKGIPSNRLKTDDELAMEEAEKLKQLEADRIKCMRGELSVCDAPNHVSADSLNEGLQHDVASSKRVAFQVGGDLNRDDYSTNENTHSDGKEDDSDSDYSGVINDTNCSDDDDDDGSYDGAVDEDDYSDIPSEDDDIDEEHPEECASGDKKIATSIMKSQKSDIEKLKQLSEAASIEMPYTFEVVTDVGELATLLSKYSVEEQVTILQRMVSCNHPSLAEGNKQKLVALFSHLLQYIMEVLSGTSQQSGLELLNRMVPLLHQIMQHDSLAATHTISQLLHNRCEQFHTGCHSRVGKGCYLGVDSLMLLTLVGLLYSTSDLRHPIVTPAIHLIIEMLGQVPVRKLTDVATGLYLCCLVYEFVYESKRFVPQVLNYLHGVLFMATEKDSNTVKKVFPPFKTSRFFANLLNLKEKVDGVEELSIVDTVACDSLNTDRFRVSCINVSLSLVQDFYNLYSSFSGANIVFSDIAKLLPNLQPKLLPTPVKELANSLQSQLETQQCIVALARMKVRPQPMTLLDPLYADSYDGRKKRKGDRSTQLVQRMKYKIKRETRGVRRKLRRDSQFVARQKVKEMVDRDNERKEAVKRLYASLSNQEGEFRAIKRKKAS